MSVFYRFPVALLSLYPGDPLATLNQIIDWCVVDVGIAICEGLDSEEVEQHAQGMDEERFDKEKPKGRQQQIAFIGQLTLKITGLSLPSALKRYSNLNDYLDGCDPPSVMNRANMKHEWIWNCLYTLRGKPSERTMSWREFRILAAILSKVGSSKYAKCGWQEIQARAAGWCGKVNARAATPDEQNRREPLELSREMIRSTLNRLEADKFFARFQYARHETWFSFSCGDDRSTLVKWIADMKSRRNESLADRRDADAKATALIQDRKGKGASTKKTKQPPSNH